MNHRPISFVAGLVMLAAMVLPGFGSGIARAQDAPNPSSLLRVEVDDAVLPPAPVFVRLLRITMEPGSSSPNHTHPGPEIWRVESGEVTVKVQGPTIYVKNGSEDKPASAPVNKDVKLGKGDQITFLPGTALTFVNKGDGQAKILAVVILPAGHQRPPGITYVSGQPSADAFEGIRSDILGDGLADLLPSGSTLLTVDRLDLTAGQPLPAEANPVLVSVAKGGLNLTVKGGRAQISRTATPGPQADSQPNQSYELKRGDAIFFPAGMKAAERNGDFADVSVYRVSIIGQEAPATPTSDDQVGVIEVTGPAAPPSTPTAEATATAEATEPPTAEPTKEPTKEPTAEPTKETGAFEEGQTVYVNDSDVRLRDAPTTDSNIVTGLTLGQALVITGASESADGITWWPVTSPDDETISGWVAAQFLSEEPPA